MLTREQIERNREFLKDLRANEKKQTCSMRGDDGERCCLCVAMDTAVRLGWDEEGLSRANFSDIKLVPPKDIKGFYGWDSNNPNLISQDGIKAEAAAFNDGRDADEDVMKASMLTHKEIADLFENTFPELKQ